MHMRNHNQSHIHARTSNSTFTLEPNTPPQSNPITPNRLRTCSHALTTHSPNQVQTPQQRRANEAFATSEAAQRGQTQEELERRAEKKKAAKLQQKSPVSKVWLCKF